MTRTITPGQVRYIESLCESRQIDLDSFHGVELDPETFPISLVTSVLDYLKGLPVPAKATAELEAGMYRLPSGEIFKVVRAVHGSGRMYAKALVMDTMEGPEGPETEIWFEMAPGAIRRIRAEHRMSLEEAKAFGSLYGVCCVCAAILTAEDSIAAGIGPVCGGRV